MLNDKEAKSRGESQGLSAVEIEHIAKLVRIKLSGDEKEKFKKEISSILGYVKKLNELETESVEPLYQVTGLINALRADEHRGDFAVNEKLNKKLIGQAPQSENRFVKVKPVLKR